ncbi:uncharacterized protein [Apostichopus japonicus]|uniref:uncharacterized protein isoform X1 n=1 Tax=Stichopus japonicus TaxID=307972 RepID=UPI003AB8C475
MWRDCLYVGQVFVDQDPTVTICPERSSTDSQSTVQHRHTEELSDGPIVVTTVTGISAFILGCLSVIGVQCVLRIFQRRKLLKQDRQKTSENTPGMMISFINDSLSNETSLDNFIKDTPPQPTEYTRVIDNMESGQLLRPMSEYARAIEKLEIGQFPHAAHTSNQNKLHTVNDCGKYTNETYEIVGAAVPLPKPQVVKNIKRF